MTEFLSRHWFTLLLGAFIGLAVWNNVNPPPEPERNQVLWPPPPKRATMSIGPCTDWKSGLVVEAAKSPEGQKFTGMLARQLRQAAIIGESDEVAGGQRSREARGLGLRVNYLPGQSGQHGRIELTVVDLCRLFLLDHASEPILPGASPESTAAAVRSRIDRLMPVSYRSPVVELLYFEPLEEAPPELPPLFREAMRTLAAEDEELLLREPSDAALRLEGAALTDNPAEPPVAVLATGIRVGRYGESYVAHLLRKIPSEGEETIEGATLPELAENVTNRLKRIAYAR